MNHALCLVLLYPFNLSAFSFIYLFINCGDELGFVGGDKLASYVDLDRCLNVHVCGQQKRRCCGLVAYKQMHRS